MCFFLEQVDLLPKLFDQLQFFQYIHRFTDILSYFSKGSLEQSIREEEYVLNGEYLDGVISMLILADPTKDLK